MAREINWDEPLSDEDRAWAEQRGDQPARFGQNIRQAIIENDERFGKAAKEAQKTRQEQIEEAYNEIGRLETKIERLQREQAEEDNKNVALAGSLGDQARGLGFRDQTPVNGETPEGADTSAEDYSDEKKWTKASLSAEIDKRNDERIREGLEPLARTGNRSELVERLQKDDDELAQD
jgi:hypothetical protein